MANRVPQKQPFEVAEKYYAWFVLAEYLSIYLSLVLTILSFFDFYKHLKGFAAIASATGLFLLCFFRMRYRFTYREAEAVRRDSLIDSSFGTKMTENKEEGYYDNANINLGLRKLLSAVHESCLLTTVIVEAMLKKQERITLIVCVITIICALSSLQADLIIAIFEGFIALNIVEDYFELKYLRDASRHVSDDCMRICEDYSGTKRTTLTSTQQAHVVRTCIRYECALSYASMMLDKNVYLQLNAMHAERWKEIKERFY